MVAEDTDVVLVRLTLVNGPAAVVLLALARANVHVRAPSIGAAARV